MPLGLLRMGTNIEIKLVLPLNDFGNHLVCVIGTHAFCNLQPVVHDISDDHLQNQRYVLIEI